ncbi:TetR/AcrR family transcriptional regulator [Gammaproteobacteria bacterium]|nr:TetR/AcrR family transcriptional regulator [Gammaproteobacteria bacterium]MDA9102184.1 TetR/AcrR family transcriptional regulator [Gammaproteobacteria bacterium]
MKSYHHGNLKEELISYACTICERDGYTKLSIRSLAKESNVSQTAPYRHFKTKEEVYAAVAAEGFSKLYKAVFVESNKLTLKDFIQSSKNYIDFGLQNANTYDLMFGTAVGDFSQYPELVETANKTFESLVLNLSSFLKDKDEDILAGKSITVWALLHGMVGILRKQSMTENDVYVKEFGPMSTTRRINSDLPTYLERVLTGIIES